METQGVDKEDISGSEAEGNEPPTLEKAEELARLLRQHSGGQSASGEAFALQGNIDSIETSLDKLKVGPVPSNLPEEVREAWKLIEGRWACQAAAEAVTSN